MMNARWSFLAVPLLAALGCSDPVPLPAQGAITLSIQKSNTTCPDSGTTYQIGAPNPPSATATGDSVVDGNGASVSCSVKKSSSGFTFSGSLQASTIAPVVPILVTFNNGVIDSTGAGTATVAVRTPKLGDTFNSGSTPCPIQVIQNQIQPGSLWVTFSCPNIVATSALSGSCGVGTSVVVFENCSQ